MKIQNKNTNIFIESEQLSKEKTNVHSQTREQLKNDSVSFAEMSMTQSFARKKAERNPIGDIRQAKEILGEAIKDIKTQKTNTLKASGNTPISYLRDLLN